MGRWRNVQGTDRPRSFNHPFLAGQESAARMRTVTLTGLSSEGLRASREEEPCGVSVLE